MNGSMAIGSRRTMPTCPAAAAVVSLPRVAPRYTPCIQLNAWKTSGLVLLGRPPKLMALILTPLGSSPTVVIFQPSFWYFFGGMSMAKLVLPQELGNAAAT